MISTRFVVFGFCGTLGCSQPAPAPAPAPMPEVQPSQTIESTEEPADTSPDDELTPGDENAQTVLEFFEPTDSPQELENEALIEDIQTPSPPKPIKREGPACKKTSDCRRYPLPKDGSYWKCLDNVCVRGNHFSKDALVW